MVSTTDDQTADVFVDTGKVLYLCSDSSSDSKEAVIYAFDKVLSSLSVMDRVMDSNCGAMVLANGQIVAVLIRNLGFSIRSYNGVGNAAMLEVPTDAKISKVMLSSTNDTLYAGWSFNDSIHVAKFNVSSNQITALGSLELVPQDGCVGFTLTVFSFDSKGFGYIGGISGNISKHSFVDIFQWPGTESYCLSIAYVS